LLYDAKRMLDDNVSSEDVKKFINGYMGRNLTADAYTRIQYD